MNFKYVCKVVGFAFTTVRMYYNEPHFKSFLVESEGKEKKGRGYAVLSGRNVAERGCGTGGSTFEGSSVHAYRSLHSHARHVYRLRRMEGPGVTNHFT